MWAIQASSHSLGPALTSRSLAAHPSKLARVHSCVLQTNLNLLLWTSRPGSWVSCWPLSFKAKSLQRNVQAGAAKKRPVRKLAGNKKETPDPQRETSNEEVQPEPRDDDELGGLWGTSNEDWSIDDMDMEELEALFDELDAELEADPNIRVEGERILEGLEEGSLDGDAALERMAELLGRNLDELGLELTLRDEEPGQIQTGTETEGDDDEEDHNPDEEEATSSARGRSLAEGTVPRKGEALVGSRTVDGVSPSPLAGSGTEGGSAERLEGYGEEVRGLEVLTEDDLHAIFDELDAELEADDSVVLERGMLFDNSSPEGAGGVGLSEGDLSTLVADWAPDPQLPADSAEWALVKQAWDASEPTEAGVAVTQRAKGAASWQAEEEDEGEVETGWAGPLRVAAEAEDDNFQVGDGTGFEQAEEEGEDSLSEGEDGGGDLGLVGWQVRKLRRALERAGGNRRKVQVAWLVGETSLDRQTVLAWLKNPSPQPTAEQERLPDHTLKVSAKAANSWKGSNLLEQDGEEEEEEEEEEESTSGTPKVERARWGSKGKRIKREHLDTLERVFRHSQKPSKEVIANLVALTHLPRKNIVGWFEERRGGPEKSTFSSQRRSSTRGDKPIEQIDFIGPDVG